MGYYVDDYGNRHDDDDSYGGCSLELGKGIIWLFVILVGFGVAKVLITTGIEYVAYKSVELGILKPKVIYEISQGEHTGLDYEDISIVLRQTDGDKEYYLTISEDGLTSTQKIRGGTYSTAIESPGIAVYVGDETYDLPKTYPWTVKDFALYSYAAMLEFYDTSGNSLMPENVTITFSIDSEEITVFPMWDSTYFVLFELDYAESGSMKIKADGYQTVELDYTELPRVSCISVVLEEAS